MEYIVYFMGLAIGFLLSLIIHELGHLVFGISTGYRFISFRIMKWLWTKDQFGKIKRTSGSSIKGIGGQCLLEPPEDEKDFCFILYNLGGGLANIVTSVIMIVVGIFLLNINNFFAIGFFFVAYTALCLGVINLVPISVGGIPNDGKNIKEALKSDDAKHGMYIMLKANAKMSKGMHLSDFDRETFKVNENADVNNFFVASIMLLQASQLEELGLYEESYQILLKLNPDQLPPFYGNQLIMNIIFHELVFFGENFYIRQAQERVDAKSKDKVFKNMLKMKHPSFLTYCAAKQAFLEYEYEKAKESIKQARKLLPTLQNTGNEHSLSLMLDRLEEKIMQTN